MQKSIYPYDVIIADTSSLSNFRNINRFDILQKLYKTVTITSDILDEYKDEYKDELPNWIKIKKVKNKEKIIELNNDFGIGESSAIALAIETPNTLVIIDDQEAKIFASNIGLNVIGSIGVIKQAFDRKIVKSKEEANNLFDELKNTGAWINEKLLESIKYPIDKETIEEMRCYKYDIKREKIIDYKGNEIIIKTMEIISEKDNIYKLECKDKKENNIYILQRIKEGNTESWYFDKDFNKKSAINFISWFEREKEKQFENKFNKNNESNNGTSGGIK